MATHTQHGHEHGQQHQHGHSQAASEMRQAAIKFLDSLSADQKRQVTFNYVDGERVFWYYPPMNRHGLLLREMDESQRTLAYALMASGLSPEANQQARAIIDHELVLGPLEVEQNAVTYPRDPLLYAWSIFGDPSNNEQPWGWRVEGHHVSLHYSIWGDRVLSSTPFFFGANPARVPKGPKEGLRILGTRQDLALELMESMDSGQRSKAIIYREAPADILTFNASQASLPEEAGIPASQLSGTQKEVLTALVAEYFTRVRADLAQERLDRILHDGGIDNIHVAWGGPVDRSKPHYYRLHGGSFVVEYDNRQNGANHIHSVWRDVKNDFAYDVLREHLIQYHIL
jgi:hypothetical protein